MDEGVRPENIVRAIKVGDKIPMSEKYKYGIEDPNDIFEIEYMGIEFGKHRFMQYKNGAPIRGIFALNDEEFRELSLAK